MFEITKNIIEETEFSVLELKHNRNSWGMFARHIIFPLRFLRLGLGDFLSPVSIYSLITFILIFLASQASHIFSIPKEYITILFNCCLCIPMAIVIFAAPSTYAYYGINTSNVKKVSGIIASNGLDSKEKIELLEKNLELIEERVNARVSFYKWLVASLWAIYIIIFNIEIRYELGEKLSSNKANWIETLITFSFTLVFTMMALLLIAAYKRASDHLVKCVKFGCIEQKFELLDKEQKPT